MRAQNLGLKLLAILFIVAVAFFGLMFISGLVSERQGYHQDFINDISRSQISAQTVVTPFIRVPYPVKSTCIDDNKKEYACDKTQWAFFPAQHSQWAAKFNITDDNYKRGIYRAISYSAHLTGQGQFAAQTDSSQAYQWNQAEIVLPIQDPRGLNAKPSLVIAGQSYPFEFSPQDSQRNGLNFMRISGQQRPEILAAITKGFAFQLQLESNGLSKFNLIPTSQSVSYQADGNWSEVKYDGQNLPFEKLSQSDEFSAKWKNIALGQQNLNRLVECSSNDCLRALVSGPVANAAYESEAAFDGEKIGLSTEFLQAADVYTQTDRAIKYGIAIIFISFACFFLFEVLKGLPIHPIQYALVAMAQGIFFVLLLSISEYYAFALAYVVAAIACISLITWYLYFVMQGIKPAAIFGVILSLLYAMIYLLLQSSSKTFLIGAVISFLLLAAVMFVTRHVNWYQLQQKTINANKPTTMHGVPSAFTQVNTASSQSDQTDENDQPNPTDQTK
ncbi:inner membrane protein [Acinetobacter calcoaceticus]|uniref:Inner membrane protein n=1 Tax=Acinetobacter calcoaceticus TaxID=471 RepID=A0A4R1Y8J9_ACICA|nr:inner membrane protein [Acinetobacter calcoaceticus]